MRVLVVLLLIVAPVSAQVVQLTVTYQTCTPNRCVIQRSGGTAVNVGRMTDGKWLFVSAGHIFGDELNSQNQFYPKAGVAQNSIKAAVRIGADNDSHDAKFLGYWLSGASGTDLSFWAVSCTAPRHVSHLATYCLTTERPKAGTAVTLMGRAGTVERSPRRFSAWLHTTDVAKNGDSGGPVMAGNCVVGIISGGGPDDSGRGSVGRNTPSKKVVEVIRSRWPNTAIKVVPLTTTKPPAIVDKTKPADPNGRWASIDDLKRTDAQTKRNKLRLDTIESNLRGSEAKIAGLVTTVMESMFEDRNKRRAEFESRITQLELEMTSLELKQGRPGADGKQGPPGKDGARGIQGPQGPPGDTVELNADELRAIVEKVIADQSIKGRIRVRVRPQEPQE